MNQTKIKIKLYSAINRLNPMNDFFDLTNIQTYLEIYDNKRYDYYNYIKEQCTKFVQNPVRIIKSKFSCDDFYSNLIDWVGDIIFYAVQDSIFEYNFYTEINNLIFSTHSHIVTSIKYQKYSGKLCIGTSNGLIYILDLKTGKHIKRNFHKGRIGILESYGEHLITGGRDRKCNIIDLKIGIPIACFESHFQEVCGISLNNYNKNIVATGGNDNNVFLFDMRRSCRPFMALSDHKAAVKGISWSYSNEYHLITGGGTADKTIKHWDISSRNPLLNSYNFESQICNLKWLKNDKILGTFGYSNDDIKLLDGFKTEKCYTGHKNRVLHLSIESQENFFVSGSSDSTIRIWSLKPEKKENIII